MTVMVQYNLKKEHIYIFNFYTNTLNFSKNTVFDNHIYLLTHYNTYDFHIPF